MKITIIEGEALEVVLWLRENGYITTPQEPEQTTLVSVGGWRSRMELDTEAFKAWGDGFIGREVIVGGAWPDRHQCTIGQWVTINDSFETYDAKIALICNCHKRQRTYRVVPDKVFRPKTA